MCNNSTSTCNCIYQTYLCSLFPSPLFNKYVQIIESTCYSHAYYKSQGYHSRWMVYHPIREGRLMVNIYINCSYHSFTSTIIIFLMVASLSPLAHQDCKDTRSKFTQYLLLVGSTSLNNVAFVS